jgi:SWI/SNF-related matrix-associated actin-dependent regulator 1 of chromatin subfamily A
LCKHAPPGGHGAHAPTPANRADIYAIQQRKLRLDAAVLEGVTISTEVEGGRGRGRGRGGRGRGGVSAEDARHMGAILAALLGDEEEDEQGGGGAGGSESMGVSAGAG